MAVSVKKMAASHPRMAGSVKKMAASHPRMAVSVKKMAASHPRMAVSVKKMAAPPPRMAEFFPNSDGALNLFSQSPQGALKQPDPIYSGQEANMP